MQSTAPTLRPLNDTYARIRHVGEAMVSDHRCGYYACPGCQRPGHGLMLVAVGPCDDDTGLEFMVELHERTVHRIEADWERLLPDPDLDR